MVTVLGLGLGLGLGLSALAQALSASAVRGASSKESFTNRATILPRADDLRPYRGGDQQHRQRKPV
jgi:hypothetical protein